MEQFLIYFGGATVTVSLLVAAGLLQPEKRDIGTNMPDVFAWVVGMALYALAAAGAISYWMIAI